LLDGVAKAVEGVHFSTKENDLHIFIAEYSKQRFTLGKNHDLIELVRGPLTH
jgi:hypothetical protein